MPWALTILVGFTFLGGALAQALHLPLPGPVVGMFLLVMGLLLRQSLRRRRRQPDIPVPPLLGQLSDGLIGIMGLMFIPAGVGIITELTVLRQQWLPVVVALVASTLLSLLATGLAMQWILHRQRPTAPTTGRVKP